MNSNTPREWEKEFDEKHRGSFPQRDERIKSFIRTIEDKAREAERERVRKLVEGMRENWFIHSNDCLYALHEAEECSGFCQAKLGQETVDHIITALNEKV